MVAPKTICVKRDHNYQLFTYLFTIKANTQIPGNSEMFSLVAILIIGYATAFRAPLSSRTPSKTTATAASRMEDLVASKAFNKAIEGTMRIQQAYFLFLYQSHCVSSGTETNFFPHLLPSTIRSVTSVDHESISFPDIKTCTFIPGDAHREFCKGHHVSICLLHSHEGFSELLFYDDGKMSRPANSKDKEHFSPCSYFLNKAGQLTAFEWTTESLTRSLDDVSDEQLQAIVTDLISLNNSPDNSELGFSFRSIPGALKEEV